MPEKNASEPKANAPVEKAPEKAPEKPAAAKKPRVRLETSLGDIIVELDPEKAPKTVENFLAYVKERHFDRTVFHRVIPNFMIQGGGFTAEGNRRDTHKPIPNEATNGLKNLRGTIAMARTSDVNSATDQFFINHKDNGGLDHKDRTARGFGYAVFGKVVAGMDVVDEIAKVQTGTRMIKTPMGTQPMRDWPVQDVTILAAVLEK
ncbi:MAG: peptidyl-prolyl cis-trans isomerase [Planctomycetes bacterium]|nr:peptidyl-prolyl cis-trans isomerase [Planctomycetota bacterium]